MHLSKVLTTILAFIAAAIYAILFIVVAQFKNLFEGFNAELPFLVKFVLLVQPALIYLAALSILGSSVWLFKMPTAKYLQNVSVFNTYP